MTWWKGNAGFASSGGFTAPSPCCGVFFFSEEEGRVEINVVSTYMECQKRSNIIIWYYLQSAAAPGPPPAKYLMSSHRQKLHELAAV